MPEADCSASGILWFRAGEFSPRCARRGARSRFPYCSVYVLTTYCWIDSFYGAPLLYWVRGGAAAWKVLDARLCFLLLTGKFFMCLKMLHAHIFLAAHCVSAIWRSLTQTSMSAELPSPFLHAPSICSLLITLASSAIVYFERILSQLRLLFPKD